MDCINHAPAQRFRFQEHVLGAFLIPAVDHNCTMTIVVVVTSKIGIQVSSSAQSFNNNGMIIVDMTSGSKYVLKIVFRTLEVG